eukprot:g2706.t1
MSGFFAPSPQRNPPGEEQEHAKAQGQEQQQEQAKDVQQQESERNGNIWVAASDGNLERVQELVQADAELVNAHDENGYSPLAAAASYGHIEIIRFLIRNGADVNFQDTEGDTALHCVSTAEAFDVLLEAGADTSLTNNEGKDFLAEQEENLADIEEGILSQLSALDLDADAREQVLKIDADVQAARQLVTKMRAFASEANDNDNAKSAPDNQS